MSTLEAATVKDIRMNRKVVAWAAAALLSSGSVAHAGQWVIETLPDTPKAELCRDLLKRVSHVSEMCARDAFETFPEFTSPPWEILDPEQHIELIAKLLQYAATQPQYRFKTPAPDLGPARQWARTFIAHGGRLQIWRTRLLSYFDANGQRPAPPGTQAVVLLSSAPGSDQLRGACADNAAVSRTSQTFIVLPDLSGPDPAVEPGIDNLLERHRPVIYRGETLLIGSSWSSLDGKTLQEGEISIFKNFEPTGLRGGDCALGFDPDATSDNKEE